MEKLRKLVGTVPLLYSQSATYTMCSLINALVDEVNRLSKELQEVKTQIGE